MTAPAFTPVPRTVAAVFAGQIGRARAGGGAVVLVATVQALAILVLLHGMGGSPGQGSRAAVTAGATFSVAAFIGWNLLAQRTSALKHGGGLEYYGTLPVRPAAVVLGFCACYGAFALPGIALSALAGTSLFALPTAHLWVLVPATVTSCLLFSALGALSGLGFRRPETAALAGQLGLTLAMFVGLVPPQSLPGWLTPLRAALPLAYDVDALASALSAHPHWTAITARLLGSALAGACCLALASRAYRSALDE
ncbi:ABC transporter permease [Actinomadura gamaensis]|uniref:ABC transporter permease n=1 Tax=Actinomadura gamaensis TaxID=1763541 RepID=A0ABV9TSM1_9ACTN